MVQTGWEGVPLTVPTPFAFIGPWSVGCVCIRGPFAMKAGDDREIPIILAFMLTSVPAFAGCMGVLAFSSLLSRSPLGSPLSSSLASLLASSSALAINMDVGAGGHPGGQSTLAWLDEHSQGGK